MLSPETSPKTPSLGARDAPPAHGGNDIAAALADTDRGRPREEGTPTRWQVHGGRRTHGGELIVHFQKRETNDEYSSVVRAEIIKDPAQKILPGQDLAPGRMPGRVLFTLSNLANRPALLEGTPAQQEF